VRNIAHGLAGMMLTGVVGFGLWLAYMVTKGFVYDVAVCLGGS
jgi:hypothetical protein